MRRSVLLSLGLAFFAVVAVLLAWWRLDYYEEPADTVAATRPAVTIGYSAPEWNGGQFLIMDNFRKEAESRGWDVKVTTANSDFETQKQQLEYFISQQVQAIVAVPVDSEKIAASVERAHAQGIPFYTIDRAVTRGQVDMTVQADNRLAGKQAGEAMAAALKSSRGEAKGIVLELQGELSQSVARDRRDGFHEAMKSYPQVTIISRETGWHGHVFADETLAAIQQGPLDGIYLHSDMIGTVEVLPALRQAGRLFPVGDSRHIAITGVDGSPPALQGIRDGMIDAVASQPIADFSIIADWIDGRMKRQPVQIGEIKREGAAWSPATVRDTQNGPLLQLRTVLVTRDNVENAYLWGNQVERIGTTRP